MSQEAGLRFWLHYAERQGAIFEDVGEKALVLLPSALQRVFELPEDVAVTTDPDVAAEDGAVLLIPGHPLLEQTAARVLEKGDIGHGYAVWPQKGTPSPTTLLEHARDQFPVEHGRIDAADEPTPVYLPLLHLGVLITYTVDERFQEREAVWVDARTGLPLSGGLHLAPLPAPDSGHPALLPDVALALREAHAQIEQRAALREQALARQVGGARQEELERATAYYEAALDSIARRREAAPAERQSLLDAQAEATRLERSRRFQEIEEKFRARHDVRPFRLHLMLAPALYLPVHVRRGERRYPLALTWLLASGRFTAVRCPHCGAVAPLIAGRERLGCTACLAPAVAVPLPASPKTKEAPAAARSGGTPAAAVPPRQAAPEARGKAAPAAKAVGRKATPKTEAPAAATYDDKLAEFAAKLERARKRAVQFGVRFGVDFWNGAITGEVWRRKQVVPDSPLSVLYRLYGAIGPLHAVGIPPSQMPTELTEGTGIPDFQFVTGTTGVLRVRTMDYPYTIRWHLEQGDPMLFEVVPFENAFADVLPPPYVIHPSAALHLFAAAPRPNVALDAVGAALWKVDIGTLGLPLLLRYLAAWWRVRDQAALADTPTLVLAAALSSLVGQRAGLRRPRAAAAAIYGVEAAAVQQAGRQLQKLLNLSAFRAW